MSLAAAQREFLDRLLAPGGEAAGGWAVYRRTVSANRQAALAAAYPVVARLVGDAFFGEAAARYAQAHPSTEGDLHRFGAYFAAFLAGYPYAVGLPYLPDVARLDWATFRCEFAADPVPFALSALAALPPSRRADSRFAPQDGVALIASAHPVVSIREANQPDRDGTLAGEWGPETAIVYRRGLEVVVGRAGAEASMLQGLLAGNTLGEACRDEADTAALPRWVAAGIFRGILG